MESKGTPVPPTSNDSSPPGELMNGDWANDGLVHCDADDCFEYKPCPIHQPEAYQALQATYRRNMIVGTVGGGVLGGTAAVMYIPSAVASVGASGGALATLQTAGVVGLATVSTPMLIGVGLAGAAGGALLAGAVMMWTYGRNNQVDKVPSDTGEITLECSICLESYNENEKCPRVLACGHTFCSACLANWTKDNEVECPTCRRKTPSDDVPKNFAVLQMLAAQSPKEPPK